MQLGAYRTTLTAAPLSSVFRGKMMNRGIKSRADGNSVNSKNNLTDHESGQPQVWSTSKSGYEEEFPSLSVSNRRTRIDLGTHCQPKWRKVVDNVDKLQIEPSTSISHQDDTFLPTSFGKKPLPSSSRNPMLRQTYHENGEGKRRSTFSKGTAIDEPFDICISEAREYNPLTGQVLRPGMVLFKNYIPLSEQVKIVNRCRELGCGPGGFYRPGYDDGAKLRLYMMCLGLDWNPQTRKYGERRHHDQVAAPGIPHEFTSLVRRVLDDSHTLIKRVLKTENVEDVLPAISPDLCIVNFYTTNGRLGLHQKGPFIILCHQLMYVADRFFSQNSDSHIDVQIMISSFTQDTDESPDSLLKGFPVVSVSIGDSAEFLYGDQRDVGKAESVLLKSGDVLIFGGESRRIFHGVKTIIPDTAPHALLDATKLRPGRLNLTFRKY
ncbi:uncharacterized protein LOC105174637 isoform X1 [Sesamum indicum]|uniref:Uncharacterized protein LOC105174637 isoform X1 n=1 Tax=Sesamum indicum TaxID=4182 RepID=A0A6I9U3R3_SESIN|nr:uncharacterized protein LOC105174637 isoform X1 [Sesamum indicum]